ncbi:MAG TPA: UDP-3-O-(3-hydroxymyristoyl)glucosamine N-acyltransferase [Gemmatimonadaceae bacterium]|nr:UDP-3-O-(3-hydroxymyristoyl)glucosamine N-acyltransferase [Gemmatimonadaceae bacterium]
MSREESSHENGGEGGFVLTADAIATEVGGILVGDPSTKVRRIAPLDRATGDELSFLASPKYVSVLAGSRAGVVLVSPDLSEAPGGARARIVVAKPHEALLSLIPRFYRAHKSEPGIHATARIGRGVRLGDGVSIGPYAVLGDGAQIGNRVVIDSHTVIGAGVEIASDCHFYPSTTAYSGTVIGKRVIVHAGARLGSDGFGYVFRDGRHEKIPHVGRCVIEDDVEIGANTTIDRGSIDDTVIGAGTKIDNLVHIAHNVRIGRLCLIMAQVGIAGSVRVEDGCVLAGQVGISGHHTIGKGATIAAQAGVFGDIPGGETWSGYPARPHKDSLRAHAALFRLAPLLRKLEKLLESNPRGADSDR